MKRSKRQTAGLPIIKGSRHEFEATLLLVYQNQGMSLDAAKDRAQLTTNHYFCGEELRPDRAVSE